MGARTSSKNMFDYAFRFLPGFVVCGGRVPSALTPFIVSKLVVVELYYTGAPACRKCGGCYNLPVPSVSIQSGVAAATPISKIWATVGLSPLRPSRLSESASLEVLAYAPLPVYPFGLPLRCDKSEAGGRPCFWRAPGPRSSRLLGPTGCGSCDASR